MLDFAKKQLKREEKNIDELKKFFERYNCTISLDYMSNLDIEEGINTTVCMDGRYIIPKKVKELLPDIVISFGGQIFSSIKEELQPHDGWITVSITIHFI